MKKSKYISSTGYDHTKPTHFEVVLGASATVAGESYTVRELFERHLRGQLPDISRESYFEDTQDFDAIDFNALKNADPFEKEMLLIEVQEKAKKAQQALQKWQKEQAEKTDSDDSDSPPPKKPKKSDKTSDKEPGSKRSDATDATESDVEKD